MPLEQDFLSHGKNDHSVSKGWRSDLDEVASHDHAIQVHKGQYEIAGILIKNLTTKGNQNPWDKLLHTAALYPFRRSGNAGN